VFQSGILIWPYALGTAFGVSLACFLIVPIYYPLGLTSIYQYLEKRFRSSAVRRVAVFSFIIKTLIYMGICLYGPAVALNSVTPLSTEASILICGIICTIYTSIGGMKSVLWTDTFQTVLIFAGQISVLAIGASTFGGFDKLWKLNKVTERVKLPDLFWVPDPTIRHSIWSTFFGSALIWMMLFSSQQSVTQRIMCLPNTRTAMLTVRYIQ
jgi:Na+/proline symporter